MFDSAQPSNTEKLFEYHSPFKKFIGIVSIPHSGEQVPPDMKQLLTEDEMKLKCDVDYKVNELVDIKQLQENGIAVIVSNIHRVSVDLNRDEDNCILFWKQNTQGQKLVLKEPTQEQIEEFKTSYYRPYYEMLKSMISELEKRQDPASVVDLHSMPSAPTPYHMKQNPSQKTHRPDFCISDRHGLTCTSEFIGEVTNSLSERGYECTNNDPYIGGHITGYVNGFKTNNIQIEINRGIYMDEVKKELVASKAEALKPNLTQSLVELFTKFNK